MYNKSFNKRPSSGGSRFSSNGARGGFRSAPKRAVGNRFASKRIDVSRYISKAKTPGKAPEVFKPKHTFADFAVDERLKKNIIAKGYVNPTPIQDQAIPLGLEGRDIVGIANTGTGKTAAFLIPLVDKTLKNKREQVLILAPTRELAIQIEEELRGFAKGLGLFGMCAVGGAPIGKQIRDLKHHNNFVIGTPGRIKDLIERKALDLSGFRTVVLDEADRMLDMGFIGDMRFLIAKMSKEKHTLFFSATLSPEIEKLIKDFLHDPVRISVRKTETAENVEQDVVRVPRGGDKMEVLHDLLGKDEFEKVLIFGRTKHGVEKISKTLAQRGHKAVSIHGNKNQGQRQRALEDFKRNHSRVLVATDVAARGLDINDVSHVINFDVPATHEDYIHRIGRTGRAGKKGIALTFVD